MSVKDEQQQQGDACLNYDMIWKYLWFLLVTKSQALLWLITVCKIKEYILVKCQCKHWCHFPPTRFMPPKRSPGLWIQVKPPCALPKNSKGSQERSHDVWTVTGHLPRFTYSSRMFRTCWQLLVCVTCSVWSLAYIYNPMEAFCILNTYIKLWTFSVTILADGFAVLSIDYSLWGSLGPLSITISQMDQGRLNN